MVALRGTLAPQRPVSPGEHYVRVTRPGETSTATLTGVRAVWPGTVGVQARTTLSPCGGHSVAPDGDDVCALRTCAMLE